MNITIQGSFEPYIWAALWQATLGGLQAGGPSFSARSANDDVVARLQYAVSLTGSAVSWAAWALSVWVGTHDSVTAGIVFGVFSLAVNVLTLIELHRAPQHAVMAQTGSFVLMPFFAFMTLSSLGIFDR